MRSSEETTAAALAVMRVFFDPARNSVHPTSLATDPFLQRVVSRLKAGESTVLPFRAPEGGEMVWIGMACTERDFRALRMGLDAFVGSTWARIPPRRMSLDLTNNEMHSVLEAYSGGCVLCLRGDKNGIYRGLRRMLRVWEARPARSYREPQAPGVLRRTFESALVSGDARAAVEALSELQEGGGLDRKNARFLDVQRLSAFGEWAEMLELPDLDDLVRSPRPAAVTDAILRAAYHVYLAAAEAAMASGESSTPPLKGERYGEVGLAAYCDDIAPQFASLLDERAPLRSVGARVVSAAAAADRGDGLALTTIQASLRAEGAESGLVAAWAEATGYGSPPPAVKATDPLTEAEAVGRLDKSAAFDLALAAIDADPIGRAALLLSFANDLRSAPSTREALEAVHELDDAARSRLQAVPWVVRVLDDLVGTTGELGVTAPESWSAWLARLRTDPTWSVAEAVEAARRGVYEWDAEGLRSGRNVEEVVNDLLSVSEDRVPALSAALPLLASTLQAAPDYPAPEWTPIYQALLEHVTYEAAPTEADVRLYADLLPAVLTGRLSAKAYEEVIEGLTTALEAREASPPPDVLLDAIDATLDATCPSAAVRLRLIAYAASAVDRFGTRWEDEEYRLLRTFAIEAGYAETVADRPGAPVVAEEAGQSSDPLKAYSDRYVAIYTLTESAGARAASILRQLAPGVRVETSAAHGGTSRLKEMAQQADVFVVVTRSATHAATDVIETHRRGKPLLRPLGKGTSSILRSLREAVP